MPAIQTKFSLGDKVHAIANRQQQKWIPCTACNASGLILLANGTEYTCPICYGRKGKTEWLPTKWAIDQIGTIGCIKADVYGGRAKRHHDNETRLMFFETGVGSGTLWDENDCFATEEEAQAECDKRNSEKQAEVA